MDRERAIAALGLDKPLWAQYWTFLDGVAHGDLGRSFVHSTSALGLILERMPATIELALTAMVIAVGAGHPARPVGGVAAERHRRTLDHGGLDPGFSLPTFWVWP
jgi:peptide/nickel transport system permease protein